MIPIAVASRQTGNLDASYQTDMIQPHFRNQTLKTDPILGTGPGMPLILINDKHPLRRPAPLNSQSDPSRHIANALIPDADALAEGWTDERKHSPTGQDDSPESCCDDRVPMMKNPAAVPVHPCLADTSNTRLERSPENNEHAELAISMHGCDTR